MALPSFSQTAFLFRPDLYGAFNKQSFEMMNLIKLTCACALLVSIAARQTAFAQRTRIEVWNYDNQVSCFGGSALDDPYIVVGLDAVELNLNACASRVYIYSCDASGNPGPLTDMPRIKFTGGPTGANPLPVLITLGFAGPSASAATPVGSNWAGLDARALGRSQFYGAIGGNLTGTINVDELYRFDAGEAIQAEVRAGATNGALGANFIVGATSITGPVVLESGTIRLVTAESLSAEVKSIGGSITEVEVRGNVSATGRIDAAGGSITTVDIWGNLAGSMNAGGAGGSIGTLTVGGNVTGKIHAIHGSFGNITIAGALASNDDLTDPVGSWPIRSLNGINKLIAGSISANITAMHDGYQGGGLGRVGLIRTTNGSMSKGLALKELVNPTGGGDSGIIINGSFPDGATMRFFNGAPRAKSIIIRDSFGGTINFEDDDDLDMQIVVNAGNSGGTWTTGKAVLDWDAVSPLSPITLSTSVSQPYQGPYYRVTPTDLGGGSIGVMPFHLHDYASVPNNPASGTSPTPVNLDTGSVVLEFYGPVKAENQAVSPVEIEYVGANSDNPYAALWFTAGVSDRALTLTRIACIPPGTYTVTPVLTGTNRLLCDVPGFASPPVADFSYRFAVSSGGVDCGDCPTCAADFDNNGGVDGGDIGAFFAAFETGSTCADVDDNGGVDGGDLAAFFLVFEAGGC